MDTNTVRLHRVLRAPPERVYRAFLDADAMAKWLPPNGFTGRVHHLDARVGGEYLALVPNELIRYTDRFDDPGLPGVMQCTVTLRPVSCGTELCVAQEGVPAMIPLEACYLGWQESLALLAKLVETEIRA
jgi:uncharacterized protein YndB with AHSA1/START domain